MTSSHFKFLRRVRIHDGECDAVARALHHAAKISSLPAAGEKVSFATQERKVMSKTTFFKRIAVTAIAALGLGILSVAPSHAGAGTPTLTVAAGSATYETGGANDTATAAFITITGLLGTSLDSYTVSFARKSAPTGGLADSAFKSFFMDTGTAQSYGTARLYTDPSDLTVPDSNTAGDSAAYGGADYESATTSQKRIINSSSTSPAYVTIRLGLMLDTATARTSTSHGDYVYTAVVTPYNNGVAGTASTADLTFTLAADDAAAALISGTVDPTKTTAYLGSATAPTADTANLTAVSTSSNTTRAYLAVKTYTSGSLQTPESITVTITGAGIVGTSAGVFGKSITIAGDGDEEFLIRSDGTAGTSSIVVSTPTKTFPAKSMRFYAAAASTVEVSVNKPVIGTSSSTDTIRATFKDASGNVWAGTAYIYAVTAADAVIAGSATTPASCTWDSSDNRHECTLTGKSAGTANFKVIDASTVAAATTTSDAVAVRVSQGVASSVELSFDKATYSPGEKAQLRIKVLDGDGQTMAAQTISNVFAASMVVSKAFGANSATLTSVDAEIQGATVAAADLNAGHQTYVVYMPMDAGTVTVSAVGGSGLAASGRVPVSTSATVVKVADAEVVAAQAAAEAASDAALEAIDAANAATDAANLAAEAADAATVAAEEARDAADAATAAVEALASEVATLMASLKAQITTLSKTVAKIAKKVKA